MADEIGVSQIVLREYGKVARSGSDLTRIVGFLFLFLQAILTGYPQPNGLRVWGVGFWT